MDQNIKNSKINDLTVLNIELVSSSVLVTNTEKSNLRENKILIMVTTDKKTE